MNDTIVITKENALKAYNNAKSKESKESIALLCGGVDKFQLDWRSVVDLESACKITGANPLDQRFYCGTPGANAFSQLEECIKAINGDWIPDWADANQPKWYIIWEYSGSGFRLDGVYDSYVDSNVGSRLSFETSDKAKHAVEHLISLFNQFLK